MIYKLIVIVLLLVIVQNKVIYIMYTIIYYYIINCITNIYCYCYSVMTVEGQISTLNGIRNTISFRTAENCTLHGTAGLR